uniref:HMG box domain-containing protein n=1 Tax=Stomoxys calcitrans TaxID=35570 RepID=A0A1I8P3D4_STOCA
MPFRRGKRSGAKEQTNNSSCGYMNFLREYRKKHFGLTSTEAVRRGTEEWHKLSQEEKNQYTQMGCLVLKRDSSRASSRRGRSKSQSRKRVNKSPMLGSSIGRRARKRRRNASTITSNSTKRSRTRLRSSSGARPNSGSRLGSRSRNSSGSRIRSRSNPGSRARHRTSTKSGNRISASSGRIRSTSLKRVSKSSAIASTIARRARLSRQTTSKSPSHTASRPQSRRGSKRNKSSQRKQSAKSTVNDTTFALSRSLSQKQAAALKISESSSLHHVLKASGWPSPTAKRFSSRRMSTRSKSGQFASVPAGNQMETITGSLKSKKRQSHQRTTAGRRLSSGSGSGSHSLPRTRSRPGSRSGTESGPQRSFSKKTIKRSSVDLSGRALA